MTKKIRQYEPEPHVYLGHQPRKQTCERKRIYHTQKQCQNACDDLSQRKGTLLVPYKCPFGDHYHKTKASTSKEGKKLMADLPKTYTAERGPVKDAEVFFDEFGPYIKRDIPCQVCGQTERAIQRLIVKDKKYVGTKGVQFEIKDIMVPIQSGSSLKKHKRCPVSTQAGTEGLEPSGEETTLEQEPGVEGLEAPPGLLKETGQSKDEEIERLKGVINKQKAMLDAMSSEPEKDFPLSDDMLMDMVQMMDPKNIAISDAHARGIGYYQVRQLLEWRMKK